MRRVLAVLAVVVPLTTGLCACKTEQATIPDATDTTNGDVSDTQVDDDTQGDTAGPDTMAPDADSTVADTADTTVADTADTTVTTVADTADTTVTTDTAVADSTAADSTVADTADTTTAQCSTAEDCQNCVFGLPVASESDCYCPICPTYPLSRTECTQNQADWATHCTVWADTNPCPVPRCLGLAAPVCEDNQCIADPNACVSAEGCQTCRFAAAPKSPADCACPGCPVPTSVTHCEAIENAIAEHCPDFDFEGCPLPPCPRPPALGCTTAGVCGYGDLAPIDPEF